jgi:hypothetical protein
MRLHNMAAGGRHEAGEEDEVWCESGSARGHDEDMAKERWYHNEGEDIKCLLNTGEHESSTAQRTSHPGYPKRETASFDNVDWRPDSIVSPPPESTAVHILCGVSPIHFSPSRRLLSATSTHCVPLLLIVLCHSFLLCRSCLLTTPLLLSSTFVARQPCYITYHFCKLAIFLAKQANNIIINVFCRSTDDDTFSLSSRHFIV